MEEKQKGRRKLSRNLRMCKKVCSRNRGVEGGRKVMQGEGAVRKVCRKRWDQDM